MDPKVDINIQANDALLQFRIIIKLEADNAHALFEIGAERIKDLYVAIKEYEEKGYSSENFDESARSLPL